MRIGIDAGRVLHGDGGVASYTQRLVTALVECATGCQIVLYDLDRGANLRQTFETAFGELPDEIGIGSPPGDLSSLDLFHAPGFQMPPQGAPSHVFTLHDLTVLSHPGFHKLDNRVRALASTAQALARGATMLAVSEATRGEAVRLLAMSGEQLEVVPPILDARFSPHDDGGRDSELLRRMGVFKPYALAVASLEPRKNFSRLLEAWEILSEDLRQTHSLVLVVSTGWMQGAVRRRLGKMRRFGEVVLLEHLDAAQLARLYRNARALVFPSLAEGFGLPIAEAMACGAPVVTSNRSSMPEVAGEAAVLVDPEDSSEIANAVSLVLGDEDLRRDLRDRGFENAAKYTAEAVVPRLVEMYRRTADQSRIGLKYG